MTERRFVQFSRAWYRGNPRGEDFIDEVVFGLYDDDGCIGEMTIEWFKLGKEIAAKLIVYDEAWEVMWQCRSVLGLLASFHGISPSPKQICEGLLACEFVDATREQEPRIPSGEWISLEDYLPPKDVWVIVWRPDGVMGSCCYGDPEDAKTDGTHWMKLEGPK